VTDLPNKPKLLPFTLAEYIARAYRAARFAQHVKDIHTVSPGRPAPMIAPEMDDAFDDSVEDD
jgi:hypothetical protein